MSELVKVLDREMRRLFYKGVPVVTLRQVEELHERPEGTARRNFNRHKRQLVAGEDFWVVPYEEWQPILVEQDWSEQSSYKGISDDKTERIAVRISYGDHVHKKQRNPVVFLTVTGYLLLVKSFGDDRAWAVQRRLVEAYFGVRRKKAAKKKQAVTYRVENVERQVAYEDGRLIMRINTHLLKTRDIVYEDNAITRRLFEGYADIEDFMKRTNISLSKHAIHSCIKNIAAVSPKTLLKVCVHLGFSKEEIREMTQDLWKWQFTRLLEEVS